MHHSFNTELAEKYGIVPAILLEHISYWVFFNKANNQNRIDGKFWTYNKIQALQELFPYMNERQIRYALQQLKAEGLILVDHHSSDTKDRTNWYTLTPKGEKECHFPIENTAKSDDKNASMQETNLSNAATNLSNVKDLLHYSRCKHTSVNNIPPISPLATETVSSVIKSYTQNPTIEGLLREFVELRQKKRKPLTARAMKMALNKLDELAGDDGQKEEIIKQTILHAWDSFYRITEEYRPKGESRQKSLEEQVRENEERLRRKGII